MQGTDFINISIVPVFDVNQYDLGDVFISPCRAGTYNEDRDSVCKDCKLCAAYQYEHMDCISTHNRVCLNCTVCTEREQEMCACTQRTPECVTGDRVCLPLPPTSANITFDLTVSTPLSALKERFLQEGLRTGFVLFLSDYLQHPPDSIVFLYMVKRTSTGYSTTFIVNDVYSLFTKTQVEHLDQAIVQGGLTNTFGVKSNTFSTVSQQRRRLLQVAAITLNAANVEAQCISQGVCAPFFEMTNPDRPCESSCVSLPCPPGYTGIYGLCDLCSNATYKALPGNDTCTPCPPGFYSDQGSVNATQCWTVPTTTTPGIITSTRVAPVTTQIKATTSVMRPSNTTRAAAASSSSSQQQQPVITATLAVTPSSPTLASSYATVTEATTSLPSVITSIVVLSIPTTSSASGGAPPSNGGGSGGWGGGFNMTFINNYYLNNWNTGKPGTVQYITINESRDEWAVITVIVLMALGLLAIAAIGIRVFFVIKRAPAAAHGYTRTPPAIPLPIVLPPPPVRAPSPATTTDDDSVSSSSSTSGDDEESPLIHSGPRRRKIVHHPRGDVWSPDVILGYDFR